LRLSNLIKETTYLLTYLLTFSYLLYVSFMTQRRGHISPLVHLTHFPSAIRNMSSVFSDTQSIVVLQCYKNAI